MICVSATDKTIAWSEDGSTYAHTHIFEDWSMLSEKELLLHLLKGEKPKIIGRIEL